VFLARDDDLDRAGIAGVRTGDGRRIEGQGGAGHDRYPVTRRILLSLSGHRIRSTVGQFGRRAYGGRIGRRLQGPLFVQPLPDVHAERSHAQENGEPEPDERSHGSFFRVDQRCGRTRSVSGTHVGEHGEPAMSMNSQQI